MATTLTPEQIKEYKGRGWLHNKGTDSFSGRVLTVAGRIGAEQLAAVAAAAAKYGSGEVSLTSRQTIEVLGVPAEKTDAFEKAVAEKGLVVGGTRRRVRPVMACKGTVCPRGFIDTFSLSEKIHEKWSVRWDGEDLPGKFKIGVGGCPNNCIKPNLNDLGVSGWTKNGKPAYKITLGGHWGRTGAAGIALEKILESEDEVIAFIARTLDFYRANGKPGERFYKTLERIGFEQSVALIG